MSNLLMYLVGPDSRVHPIYQSQLTIEPAHHPDLDLGAPCNDQEATWVKEPLLTALMGQSLVQVQLWEVLWTNSGTGSKSVVQAFIIDFFKYFEFHLVNVFQIIFPESSSSP